MGERITGSQMTEPHCEREGALVAAMRRGTLHADLLAHAGGCPVCSEVLLVAEFLREDSASFDRELAIPDPTVIWRKAQARAREKALARATLPIRIARTCAYALAILASPWIVLEFLRRPSWFSSLGLQRLASTDGNWLAALTGTTLLGVAATLLCIALSSWYMLREE
jgi:hypothetical protein